MTGLWWNEMDCPQDLHELREGLAGLEDRCWLDENASSERRDGSTRRTDVEAELPPVR